MPEVVGSQKSRNIIARIDSADKICPGDFIEEYAEEVEAREVYQKISNTLDFRSLQ